jgi:hypothetical protein
VERRASLLARVRGTDLSLDRWFTDAEGRFALALLRRAREPRTPLFARRPRGLRRVRTGGGSASRR